MLNGAGTRVDLSPAKQLLLKKRLQGQAVRTAQDSVIPRCERSGRAPLSFAQQRLWFLDQLAPGSPVYNISEGMHLVGPLDVPALGRSLKEIVRRHEAVRTTFRAIDGQPYQIISPAADLIMGKVNLSHLPEREREAEVSRLMVAEAEKPFDLTTDLMLRATLVHLTPKEHVLLLTMHHIAADAWSMGVLYRELSALYGAFVDAKKPYIETLKSGKGDSADDKKYRGLMPLVGDPLPYGLDANLRSIEAMLTYGLQQNLIPKRMPLEEAFVDPRSGK